MELVFAKEEEEEELFTTQIANQEAHTHRDQVDISNALSLSSVRQPLPYTQLCPHLAAATDTKSVQHLLLWPPPPPPPPPKPPKIKPNCVYD
jgi:hypothetical protein